MAFWGDFTQGTPAQNPGADQSVGVLDVGKEALADTAGLVAQSAGTVQTAIDRGSPTDQAPSSMVSQGINELFGAAQGYLQDSESDAAKDAQRNPLNHPLGYAALQAAGMAPAIGLFALAPEGVIANVALGSGMQASQVVGDAISRSNSMNDDQLKQAFPVYGKMRDQGMSEFEARTNLNKLQVDGGQLLASLVAGGVGGGVLGPAMRGAGMTEGNILSRAASGAVEGGAAMGAMAGDANYSGQQQNVAGGAQKDIDWGAVTDAALRGGATGALMGGATNSIFGHAPRTNNVEIVGTSQPDAAQDMALSASLGNPAPPVLPEAPAEATGAGEDTSQSQAPIQPGRAPRKVPNVEQAAGIPNSSISGRSGSATPPPDAGDTSVSPTGNMSNPVTPAGNIETSTEATVPETPDTLQAQREQLLSGNRSAMLFPTGNSPAKNGMGNLPSGMQRITVPKTGVFDFDPSKISADQIREAARAGMLNDVLGLGSTSKADAMASVQAGAAPVAVTERTPDGTEVKAAAGTTDTASQQQAELEATKSPGNTVQVEHPQQVIQDRIAGQHDPAEGAPDMASNTTDMQPTVGDEAIQAGQPAEAIASSEPAQEPKLGTRLRPIKVNKPSDMKVGRENINHDASPAQKEAENYSMLHRDWRGLPISIETAKGATRVAKDGSWEVPNFPADYGRFKGTIGADGDHVDLFQGPIPKSNRVFVIDQRDPTTGKFDEHKVMVGFGDVKAATDAYDHAFTNGSGPSRRGSITETTVSGLKDWLKSGDTKKPFTQRDATTPEQKRAGLQSDMTQKGSTKNWTKDELDNFVKADDVFDKFPPENTRLPATAAGREDLQERLEQIDQAVRDNGIQVKQSVSHASTPNSMVFLREAKQLLTELRSGVRVPLSRLHEFVTREWMLRNGEDESVKEARREAGDIASRKAPQIEDVEHTVEEDVTHKGNEPDEDLGRTARTSDEALPPEELEDAGEHGLDVQRLDGHDAIDDSSRESEEADTLDDDKVRDIAPDEGQERTKIETSSNDITAGNKAVDSGIKVAGKGKFVVGPNGEKVFLRGNRRVLKGDADLGGILDHYSFEPEDVSRVDNIRTSDFGNPYVRDSVMGQVHNAIQKRLKDLVGDVPVVKVSRESMDRVGADLRAPIGMDGFYDVDNKTIFVVDDAPPGTIMHEAVHAAFVDAMGRGTKIRKDMMSLWSHAKGYVDARMGGASGHYGFTNVDEFIAEALSNPNFQNLLANINTPPSLVPALRGGSVWDKIRNTIARFLGGPTRATETVLETVLRHADTLDSQRQILNHIAPEDHNLLYHVASGSVEDPVGTVKGVLNEPAKNIGEFAQKIADSAPTSSMRTWANKILTNDQMRQSYEKLFSSGLIRNLNDLLERADVRTHEIGAAGDKLVRQLSQAARLHQETWPAFQRLLQDVRLYEAHADEPITSPGNSHLDEFSQGYAKHAELADAYRALPKELQDLYKRTTDFFTEAHSAFARQALDEHMEGGKWADGYDLDGLKERLHEGVLTDQDKVDLVKAYGETKANALMNAQELRKSQGPYTPLSRRGDFVVQAEHDIKAPEGARRITGHNDDPNGRTYEFTDKKQLQNWLKNLDARASVREVEFDPDNGQALIGKKGADRLAEIEADQNKYPHGADIRWRASVETKHVEFLETQAEAMAAHKALATDPAFRNVQREQQRSQNPGLDLELSGSQVQTLVRSLRQNGALSDAAKKAAERSLVDASIAMQRGNRAMKHQLRAKKISGASDNIIRNAAEYNQANSRARARMEYEKDISGNIAKMKQEVRGRQDDSTLTRSEVANEMEQRVYGNYAPDPKTPYSAFMNHLMTLSFLKRMASPAHLMLHMTHPWMISAPVLAARHGAAKTAMNLVRAYRDMGAGKGLGEGLASAKRLAKDASADPTNFIEFFKKNLAGVSDHAGIGKMLDTLAQTNRIHPEAGMEVQRMAPGRGHLLAALDRVDGAFRQLTQATESINRVAEAIAAYRMEMQKSGNHEGAVRYAGDTLANTQGLYSRSNMAPLFRNAALKPFLQFKQFPQMIYHLLARNLYNAFKGETAEIRAEAAKQFAGVIATHVAMAGALGLPMEVIKAPLMLANALGVSNTTWDDVERNAYMAVAKKYGAKEAEIMMHGLSRAMGPFSVDVHHRLGLNSLFFFGEPESSKPQDSLNYLLNFVGGAPASMALDTMAGAQSLMKGDFEKGAEQILPIKAFTDVAKAARYYTEGKKTARGLPDMGAVSGAEAAVQALGFKPGEVAQHDEARNAAFRVMQEQKSTTQGMIDTWANATGKDKDAAIKKISAYNQTVPTDEKITMNQLTRALDARKDGGNKAVLGITTNGRDRRLVGDVAQAYGTE